MGTGEHRYVLAPILHILAVYTNLDLLYPSRHSDPLWSSIANGSDDHMTGVIHKPCISADHDYSTNNNNNNNGSIY